MLCVSLNKLGTTDALIDRHKVIDQFWLSRWIYPVHITPLEAQ